MASSIAITDERGNSARELANEGTEQPSLPPMDEGKDAWLVLAGITLIQAPVWGFLLAFGVFQQYYNTHFVVEGDENSLAVVGTSASGILPTTLYLDEWFSRRKGLAYGIMWAGKSGTGIALPFIMSASLERFGFATTIRAWAVVFFLMTAPILRYIKPRLPVPQSSAPRRLDLSFLKLTSFWMFQAGDVMQSLGYFLPTTYLSSYANAINLSTTIGTLMLAILNGTSVFGGIVIGTLADRYDIATIVLGIALGSSASIVFWGMSSQVALLAVFSLLYGFIAGSFSSTWSGMVRKTREESPGIDSGLMFGLLAGGRGVGNIVSGPLSLFLINKSWMQTGRRWGYQTEYGPLIIFTGITAILGGWGWLGKKIRR